ncbi:methylamine utilization protein MauJ [Methylophilus methylotrophus]|uniref:methylamine utilization protein MauJ n=1 Tax=Methylophilus methylotrophus TaxID=17 RepID=UPI000374B85B|nr:methylamine utilization protein MauJ [Methylophilus methylotrophus]
MTKEFLRDLHQEAETNLKHSGKWMVAGIETGIFWPKTPQIFPCNGFDFILRPTDEKHLPTICLNYGQYRLDSNQARNEIMKFASILSWREGERLEISTWAGGSFPINIGRGRMDSVGNHLATDNLPDLSNGLMVALALFREAISSNNKFYSFLSFYKVISSIHTKGLDRGKWFSSAISRITDHQALKRIQELESDISDIGTYLLNQGRHAIAHAEKEVFANPDSLNDIQRIYADIPIMHALAELAIEESFSYYPNRSMRRPARNLIEGFEKFIGGDLLQMVISGNLPDKTISVDVPDSVCVLVRKENRFLSLDDCYIEGFEITKGWFHFSIKNKLFPIQFIIHLELEAKLMHFNPLTDMGNALKTESIDDIKCALQLHEMYFLTLCNGSFEVWDSESGALLGKTKPFFMTNMMINFDGYTREKERLEKLIAEKCMEK